MNTQLDERDREIISDRMHSLDAEPGPRVGDFVVFADGTVRRISHDWGDSVQTSDLSGLHSGRFYLGDGFANFSGGLHPGVPTETLADTGETRSGSAWIFHHDHWTAHNGVDFEVPFRVFRCSLSA